MDILNQVVERLTKDELRFLKMYYGNAGPDNRKDMVLVDYVRQSGERFNEEKLIKKLGYSAEDKNSYYRLKNRVIQDVGDSLTLLYAHKVEFLELLHFLQLYQLYFSRSLYKGCLQYLKKAERLAKKIEAYDLLDHVYSNFIALSFHLLEVVPDEYINLRNANAELLAKLRELDNMLASVSHRLKVTQNFGSSDKQQLRQLREKARQVSAPTNSQYSKSLQVRIYQALSQVFLQQHNYTELEKLVVDTYALFEKEEWFDKENHQLKLQMLTYAANALYKNQKEKESLQYTEILGREIAAHNKLYYDQYLFFYYNLQILNNAVLNPMRALQWLHDFEAEMRRKKNYYYDTFIYLNRAGLQYDLRKYKEALKSFVKLYVSDNYTRAAVPFKFKVEISELLTTYEAGDFESLQRRIGQVRKDYEALQKQKAFKRDFDMIDLLEEMARSSNYRRDAAIQKKINALLKMQVDAAQADAEIIKYEGWLKGKAVA
ncbi:MAG: hypothetical protein U0V74_10940 [Chitinophagales bacterium]